MASPAHLDRDYDREEIIIRRDAEPPSGQGLFADATISRDRTGGKQHEADKVLKEMREERDAKNKRNRRSSSKDSLIEIRRPRRHLRRSSSNSSLSASSNSNQQFQEAEVVAPEITPAASSRRSRYIGPPFWRRNLVTRSEADATPQQQGTESSEDRENGDRPEQGLGNDREVTFSLLQELQRTAISSLGAYVEARITALALEAS